MCGGSDWVLLADCQTTKQLVIGWGRGGALGVNVVQLLQFLDDLKPLVLVLAVVLVIAVVVIGVTAMAVVVLAVAVVLLVLAPALAPVLAAAAR